MNSKNFNCANVTFYNTETNEVIGEVQTLSIQADIHLEEDIDEIFFHPFEPISLSLDSLYISGEGVAVITGVDQKPHIKKLINLHKRASKKRIKKKLNKRILNEVREIIL